MKKKKQPMTAQEMVARRNKKYGKRWVKKTALNAAQASVAARNAKKV